MRKGAIVFLIVLLAFWTFNAAADSLLFPISADQIVEALSLKDGKTEYMGVTYESKSGKVYKVIDGKRYRLRGLRIIADTKLVPKVGALINFDFDSAEIRLDSYPLLDEFGKALKGDLSIASVIICPASVNILVTRRLVEIMKPLGRRFQRSLIIPRTVSNIIINPPMLSVLVLLLFDESIPTHTYSILHV